MSDTTTEVSILGASAIERLVSLVRQVSIEHFNGNLYVDFVNGAFESEMCGEDYLAAVTDALNNNMISLGERSGRTYMRMNEGHNLITEARHSCEFCRDLRPTEATLRFRSSRGWFYACPEHFVSMSLVSDAKLENAYILVYV